MEDDEEIKLGEPKEEETKDEGLETSEPTVEEPCDPATMSCDEMRNKIMDLSDERTNYQKTIEKLDEVKKIFPSEDIDKVYDVAVDKKKQVDDEIYNTFEKFTICTKPLPKEDTSGDAKVA